jgi:hypothetical protein
MAQPRGPPGVRRPLFEKHCTKAFSILQTSSPFRGAPLVRFWLPSHGDIIVPSIVPAGISEG